MNYFNNFIVFWLLVAAITFIYLFFVNAPYGRHMQQGWGKSISARAGWVIMESPCVVLMIIYGFLLRDELLVVHDDKDEISKAEMRNQEQLALNRFHVEH